MKRISRFPLSTMAGIAAVVVYCLFVFTSWMLFPSPFSPVDNWLSDLGNTSYNPLGAMVYNVGNVLTGVFLFPFFFGLKKWYVKMSKGKFCFQIARAIGFFSAFSTIMLGVFSEDFPVEHSLWSMAFFVSILPILVLISYAFLSHPEFKRWIGYYGFFVAAINLSFLLIHTPLIEWFTVFTALGYVSLIAINTFKLSD